MSKTSIFIFTLLLFLTFSTAFKSYENYKVYKLTPTSEKHVQILTELQKQGYDFWSDVFVPGSDVRVLVSPSKDAEFMQYTRSVGLNPIVGICNVQELIRAQMQPSISRSSSLGSFDWNRYHTLAEIHAWLDELQELYPGTVTTISLGQSNEGRDLKGIVIDFNAGDRRENPLIGMIEGGIHAREWISPATVTWIIKEFLTSDDPDVRFMAETFIWHIVPVLNPDGYEYTFTTNRMWRKNRNTQYFVNCSSGDFDMSNGIDLNRNFDYLWMTIGASEDPCMNTFAGPIPSSEPEAKALSSYVLNLKQAGNFVYYFAFHSYSQMILIPYSHAVGVNVLEAENYADLYEVAIRGAEKLTAQHGTNYAVGTSAEILYAVSGSSFDWVKGVADVPIVYLFELRDVGEYGFLLPTEQIIPNNEEIMACLVEMEKATRRLGYYSGTTSVKAGILSVIIGVLFMTVQ